MDTKDLELLLEAQNRLIEQFKWDIKCKDNDIVNKDKNIKEYSQENSKLRSDNRRLISRVTLALTNPDLVKRFDDIYVYTNRWGTERICSKHVNSKCTDVYISHSCGCCADSPIEVWPYVSIDGTKVYSDPPYFIVGEGSYSYKEIEYDGWEKNLQNSDIPQEVISKVKLWFETQNVEEEETEGNE